MSTGLDTFDKTVQGIQSLAQGCDGGLDTRVTLIRPCARCCTPCAIASGPKALRISLPNCRCCCAAYSMKGWDPTGKPTKERHEAAFLALSPRSCRVRKRTTWSRASPPCSMSCPSMSIARAPEARRYVSEGTAQILACLSSRKPRATGRPARLEWRISPRYCCRTK
jgi:hypothetical protein